MKQSCVQYIFGYGSLICPLSRKITAPTLANREAIPVIVKNMERTWASRVSTYGMTAMGVKFEEDTECVGILLPVNNIELKQFDEREIGYDRHIINPRQVDIIATSTSSWKNQQNYNDDDYSQRTNLLSSFPLNNERNSNDSTNNDLDMTSKEEEEEEQHILLNSDARIWVYVQKDSIPATQCHPIVQSYVDICLRGCLSISEEFAREFIAKTKGWNPSDLIVTDDDDDDDEKKEEEEKLDNNNNNNILWVDDRHDPIYPRGDIEYSKTTGKLIDQLLNEYHPENLANRSPWS